MSKTAPDAAVVRDDAGHSKSVTARMADLYGMETAAFQRTLAATIMKPRKGEPPATQEQVASFLLVAEQHGLNPFTKEIYAYADRGGVTPVVSVDGWHKLANQHPQYDGHDQQVVHDDDLGMGIKTIIYRKDRGHPTTHTEWMNECRGPTEPWKRWPQRMLGHKSFIQCARKAFSFAGIYDLDEVERIRDVSVVASTPKPRGVRALAAAIDADEVEARIEDRNDDGEQTADDDVFFDLLAGESSEAEA